MSTFNGCEVLYSHYQAPDYLYLTHTVFTEP